MFLGDWIRIHVFFRGTTSFGGQDAQNGAVLGESHESNGLRKGFSGNIGKETKITGIYDIEKGDKNQRTFKKDYNGKNTTIHSDNTQTSQRALETGLISRITPPGRHFVSRK